MRDRQARGWVLAVVALFTFLLLGTPLAPSPIWHAWYNFFYSVIPGTALQKSSNTVANVAGFFFGTGLVRGELQGNTAVMLALIGAGLGFLSRRTKGVTSAVLAHLRKRVCLCDPLDGIVMGVASGAGFFLNQTLLQYVPKVMSGAKYPGSQAFDGMVLLLARGLPEMTEHSAGLVCLVVLHRPCGAAATHGGDPGTDRLVQRRGAARRVGQHRLPVKFRYHHRAVLDRRRPAELRVARRGDIQGPRDLPGAFVWSRSRCSGREGGIGEAAIYNKQDGMAVLRDAVPR